MNNRDTTIQNPVQPILSKGLGDSRMLSNQATPSSTVGETQAVKRCNCSMLIVITVRQCLTIIEHPWTMPLMQAHLVFQNGQEPRACYVMSGLRSQLMCSPGKYLGFTRTRKPPYITGPEQLDPVLKTQNLYALKIFIFAFNYIFTILVY